MRQIHRNKGSRSDSDAAPLDPVALTLALWLGVVVGVTGLIRLSEHAAINAAGAGQGRQHHVLLTARPMAMAFAPYGG